MILGWALGLAPLLAPPAAGADAPNVIVLSWDGTRFDDPDRALTPGLDRMARDGWRVARLIPVFPPNTFPSHVSLATGAHPDRHGIVNNRFLDPDRGTYDYAGDGGWLEAEPLWSAAERQGVRAATFFWVGSENDGAEPSPSYRKAPFDSSIAEAEKVDQILAWLDLPEERRPRLILSWWRGCDAVGHREGPDANAIGTQLREQDRELERLLAGLDARDAWDSTTLLVVSDHGMARVEAWIDPVSALRARDIEARASYGGGMAYLYLKRPSERAAALDALNALAHVRAFATDAAPPAWHVRPGGRTGHVVALTEPPFAFRPSPEGRPPSGDPWPTGHPRGGHGYAPERPEMAALLYALGRGIDPARRPETARAIDVAATVAALLGINPPRDSVGTPLPVTSGADGDAHAHAPQAELSAAEGS